MKPWQWMSTGTHFPILIQYSRPRFHEQIAVQASLLSLLAILYIFLVVVVSLFSAFAPPPIVTVSLETEATGVEIVTGLTAAIDVNCIITFRTDGILAYKSRSPRHRGTGLQDISYEKY